MDTLIIYHCNIDSIRDYLNLYFFLVKNISSEACFKIVIKGIRKRRLIESKNYTYLFIDKLENYDIGGYSLAINNTQIENYRYFIFINSSVLGPIEKANNTWIDSYKSILLDDVGIGGSSVFVMDIDYFKSLSLENYMRFPYSHVQTYSFIVNKNILNDLMQNGFFDLHNKNKNELILDFEISISQYLLNKNYNIACLLDGYNLDYRRLKKNPNPTSRNGDALYKNAYFGSTVNPFDIMFIKTNRKILSNFKKIFLISSQLKKTKLRIGFSHLLLITSNELVEEFLIKIRTKFRQLIKY
jgi:hypothetical protein